MYLLYFHFDLQLQDRKNLDSLYKNVQSNFSNSTTQKYNLQ